MTIVVGYAPTPQGEAALSAAADEARVRGAGLVVVSSTKGESHVDPTYRQTSALAHLVSRLRASGLDVQVRESTQHQDPAEAIVSAAEDVAAELVVIGVRRRSAVGKLLLGSTAQTVLMHAPCNVLAVRGKPA